ncbi:Multicopper oxidase [Alloactinosynnema sp. L-07]|nr:Multicopper oxidase [Alloactinosynnema sp. L-07]
MYETLLGMDVGISALLFITWAVSSRRLGRVARYSDPVKSLKASRGTLIWLGVATIFVLWKFAIGVLMLQTGWEFASDRVVLVPFFYLVPAIAAYVLTIPVLLRIAKTAKSLRGTEGATVPVETRQGLATLKSALPPRLTAIGGILAWYASFVVPPVPPFGDEIVFYGLILLVAAGLLVLKQRYEQGKVAAGAVVPSFGKRVGRSFAHVGVVLALVAGAIFVWQSTSGLDERYNMGEHSGSGNHAAGGHGQGGKSVADLTGPKDGEPDQRITLNAEKATISLPSGAKLDAWTFNGTIPGPQIKVKQGELVEVTLTNKDVPTGVSAHWHGVDVPNAEDGVPGLTQDAVMPGGKHVYRFRAPDVGSYWYHSHQQSSEQVRKGLYGGFIVEPKDGPAESDVKDIQVLQHAFTTTENKVAYTNGDSDKLEKQTIEAGTKVRLRLTNTDSLIKRFALVGVTYKVTAVDGQDINKPTDLKDTLLTLGGGGRYDVEFTMPSGPVRLAEKQRPEEGILFSPNGSGELKADFTVPEFDVTQYGSPMPTEFNADSKFAVSEDRYLDNQAGFFDGGFNLLWSVNGHVFPDVPTLTVREGDLVKVKFINRSHLDHPMHLHGHHALVLARNGKKATGSPIWLDTVTVAPGETWEVAFKADNPGLWMDHCHNLDHAKIGMVLHLAYEGYSTPFEAGSATKNQPE